MMRTIVKRIGGCREEQMDRWACHHPLGFREETTWALSMSCPFCGWNTIQDIADGPYGDKECRCGALHRLKSQRAVRKSKRLPKPSRKVELICWECGWEGAWGRSETVRRAKENRGWLACPECGYTPYVVTRKGVPSIVTESSIG